MFGYVTVNKDELKIKEWNRYRAYYCGLCHELKDYFALCIRITVDIPECILRDSDCDYRAIIRSFRKYEHSHIRLRIL